MIKGEKDVSLQEFSHCFDSVSTIIMTTGCKTTTNTPTPQVIKETVIVQQTKEVQVTSKWKLPRSPGNQRGPGNQGSRCHSYSGTNYGEVKATEPLSFEPGTTLAYIAARIGLKIQRWNWQKSSRQKPEFT